MFQASHCLFYKKKYVRILASVNAKKKRRVSSINIGQNYNVGLGYLWKTDYLQFWQVGKKETIYNIFHYQNQSEPI